jgi:hypothetical protein
MELGNGIFYSISRDHKQPIKRSEFNKVLYKATFILVRLCQYYNMNSVETVKVEYNNKISTAIQLILKKMKSTYRHKKVE